MRVLWRLVLWWAVIAMVPYGMFAVAWVFESRVPGRDVPVWRGQSKAFVPGDLGLALAAAVGVVLASVQGLPAWALSWQWLLVSAAVVIVTLVIGRRVLYNADDYTISQWRSPSKRYHDIVMFGVFPALAAMFVVPMYFQSWLGMGIAFRLIGIGGVACWAGGVVWDALHHEVPNANQHPHDWRPLWAR